MKTREELVKAIEGAEVAYDATWEVMIYAEDAADIAKTAAVTAARAADLARKALQAYDNIKQQQEN